MGVIEKNHLPDVPGTTETTSDWEPSSGSRPTTDRLTNGSAAVNTIRSKDSSSSCYAAAQSKPGNNIEAAANEICQAFGLTREEFTKICKIKSRKTLYNWINGNTKPRRSTMRRMFDLWMAAKAWRSNGNSADPSLLHQPVVGNQSVFDMLNEDEIDEDRILFAGSSLFLFYTPRQTIPDPFA